MWIICLLPQEDYTPLVEISGQSQQILYVKLQEMYKHDIQYSFKQKYQY